MTNKALSISTAGSTTAISLSSARAYGEVKDWPHSLEMPIRKAPGFYLT